jgi:hypothetical protein
MDSTSFTSKTFHEFETFVACHGFDHLRAYRGCDHRQLILRHHPINHKMGTLVAYTLLIGLPDDLYVSRVRAANSVPSWSPVNVVHSPFNLI